MYTLPTEIVLKNKTFHITNNGDYRMVLDCFSALQDAELDKDQRIICSLEIFYQEINSISDINTYEEYMESLINEMFLFINGGQTTSPGAERDVSLVDWTEDSQIICAAINSVAKMEIRSVPYLHWWTFIGYYMSIGQSVLSTVVGIRDKIKHGKKLDSWEAEFYRDNPNYFKRKCTEEDTIFEEYIKNLWK